MRIQGHGSNSIQLSYLIQICFAQIISTSFCFATEMFYNLIVADDGKPKHSCVLNLGLNWVSHRQTQKMFPFVCFLQFSFTEVSACYYSSACKTLMQLVVFVKRPGRVFFYVSRYLPALILLVWEKNKYTYIAMGKAPHWSFAKSENLKRKHDGSFRAQKQERKERIEPLKSVY